jgi:hypothetical protein
MIRHVKHACKSLFLRLGYEIHSIPESVQDIDFMAASTVREPKYYTQWLAPCPLFTPWLGHPDFQAVYEGAAPYTIVSPDRCYFPYKLCSACVFSAGRFYRVRSLQGRNGIAVSACFGREQEKAYLFDSFEGLPEVNERKDKWFHEGGYCAGAVESVRQL